MKFDLHVHTKCSDGLLSYIEVIDLAIKNNLKGISITDHDTISCIEPAIEYSKEINGPYIVPGIEFSCIYEKEEVHILGYFIDYKSYDIINTTKKLKKSRILRSHKIIEKINELGIDLSLKEIKDLTTGDFIGRPHIARALIKKGYVSSINEAFTKYLKMGQPAYVDRFKFNIIDTIDLIHKTGGIAVLAHPGLLENKKIINYCINKKIDGLEAIHSKHNKAQTELFLNIAENNDLISTGGSDCHGEIIDGDYLLGKYFIDLNNIPTMKGRM